VSSVRLRMGPQPCLLRAVVSAESTFRLITTNRAYLVGPRRQKQPKGQLKPKPNHSYRFLLGQQ
jgi:hypothetical protein